MSGALAAVFEQVFALAAVGSLGFTIYQVARAITQQKREAKENLAAAEQRFNVARQRLNEARAKFEGALSEKRVGGIKSTINPNSTK